MTQLCQAAKMQHSALLIVNSFMQVGLSHHTFSLHKKNIKINIKCALKGQCEINEQHYLCATYDNH